MSTMFVTVNHIPADGEAGPALEARFRARQRMVDQLPGFCAFELLRPRDSGEYLVMTSWATRADFEAWRGSPQQPALRPAHGGRLGQADVQSWPTFHETVSAIRSAAWPPAEDAVLSVQLVDKAPGELPLADGCVSVEVLQSVEGSWHGPEEASSPQLLLVSRWAGTPSPVGGARTYDILQPSYAGQMASAQ